MYNKTYKYVVDIHSTYCTTAHVHTTTHQRCNMSFTVPTVTGYSGFYTNTVGIPSAGNVASYNALPRYARSSTERAISSAVVRRGFRGMRRALISLTGAAPGGSNAETYKRIQAQTPFNSLTYGGVRAVETSTVASGVTTSAMETYIEAKMLRSGLYTTSLTYATDRSGNGGGGKRGR